MSEGPVGRWPVLALLALLTGILYAPSLDNGFSLDDYNWLERAEHRSSNADFVLSREPGQVLNPVPRSLLLLLVEAAGQDPVPYRVTVLALHVLNAFLLLHLLAAIGAEARVALAGAILFTLLTVGHEALFWIAAFFHPLVTAFVLSTVIAFVRFARYGGRATAWAAALAFLLGCLTKASGVVALAPAAAWILLEKPGSEGRRRAMRLFGALSGVLAAVGALNLATGVGDSYLLERGYYGAGPHLLANLGHYAASLLLPYEDLWSHLGLTTPYEGLFAVARWLAPLAGAALALRAAPPVRLLVLFCVAALAPFLPFVFEPVSRYTYLAAAPFAGAVALLATPLLEAEADESRRRPSLEPHRLATIAAFLIFALAAAADLRLRDNRYEHRERELAAWVADVSREVPQPTKGTVFEIVDLPRLAIDPGIHLEAALRLRYRDPQIAVRVVEGSTTPRPGAVRLRHRQGRIERVAP